MNMHVERPAQRVYRTFLSFETPVLPTIGGVRITILRHKEVPQGENPDDRETPVLRRWHTLQIRRIYPESKPYWRR